MARPSAQTRRGGVCPPPPNLLFPLAARPQFGGGRRAEGSDDRCSSEMEEGAYLRVPHVDPSTGEIACTRLSSPAIVCCLFPRHCVRELLARGAQGGKREKGSWAKALPKE